MHQRELYQDQIYYEFISKDSKKELVVLVHPLGMNHGVWSEIIRVLDDQYSVLVLDLPGHGESLGVSKETQWGIVDLAKMIQSLVVSLGYSKVHYVGTSIGGAIGQELLLSSPAFLQSLMVTNTSDQIGTKESWMKRAADVRSQGLGKMAAGIVPRWFAPEYLMGNKEIVAQWQKQLEKSDDEGYAMLCEALGNWSATARLLKYQGDIPVLAVAGEKDPAMLLENMQRLAALMKAPLEIMSVGHVPSVEDPAGFTQLLLEWLQKAVPVK